MATWSQEESQENPQLYLLLPFPFASSVYPRVFPQFTAATSDAAEIGSLPPPPLRPSRRRAPSYMSRGDLYSLLPQPTRVSTVCAGSCTLLFTRNTVAFFVAFVAVPPFFSSLPLGLLFDACCGSRFGRDPLFSNQTGHLTRKASTTEIRLP